MFHLLSLRLDALMDDGLFCPPDTSSCVKVPLPRAVLVPLPLLAVSLLSVTMETELFASVEAGDLARCIVDIVDI